ncbi:hypothetical protein RSAG8_03405, partial [Rhizoctonia solani AG-8 WAC10335]
MQLIARLARPGVNDLPASKYPRGSDSVVRDFQQTIWSQPNGKTETHLLYLFKTGSSL